MKIALVAALLLIPVTALAEITGKPRIIDGVSEITHKNGKVTGIRPEGGYSIEAGN